MNTLFLILTTLLSGAVQAEKPEMGNFMKEFKEVTGRNDKQVMNKVTPELRITGGSEVRPRNKYPFMAFIRLNGYTDAEYLCGGTLLDRTTLLTSAHCVTSDYTNYFRAFVHRHNKRASAQSEGGSEHRFSKVIAHENYSRKSGVSVNDVALVKLRTPTANMKFVRLPNPKLGDPPTDVELSIIGWGLTKSRGAQSSVLEEAQKLHLTNTCYKTPGLNKTQHLCTVGRFSADACTHDSGGPLLAPATDKGFIQVGIISAGVKCGVSRAPGVYTRVLGQLNWINNNRKRL